MAQYTIPFDTITNQFDTQFPIILSERNISASEYQETLHLAGNVYRDAHKKVFAVKPLNILILLALMGGFFACCGVCGALAAFTDLYSLIGIAPALIVFLVLLVVFLRVNRNKTNKDLQEMNYNMQQVLQTENENKYFTKGLQFLFFREETENGFVAQLRICVASK